MPDEPDVSILGKKEEAASFSKMLQRTKELHGVTYHNNLISILTAARASNVIYYYFFKVNFYLFLILDTINGTLLGISNVVQYYQSLFVYQLINN